MRYLLFFFLLSCIIIGCKKSAVPSKDLTDTVKSPVTPVTGWHAIPAIPGPHAYATAFSLNNKGFVCGGIVDISDPNAIGYDDMYMYDPVKNTWTKKAGLPILSYRYLGRRSPFSFVINNKAYAGGGLSRGGDSGRDIAEYDSVKDQWIPRFRLLEPNESFHLSLAIDYKNKGYIFSYNPEGKALWVFDPVVYSIQKHFVSVYPTIWLGSTGSNILYGIQSSIYDLNPSSNFLLSYFYDPNAYYDGRPDKPVVTSKGIFYKNSMYVSFGDAGHLYRFNIAKNKWQIVVATDMDITDGASTFLIGSKFYLVGGNNGIFSPSTNKAWVIDLDAYPE